MKKLTLESLEVTSFETAAPEAGARGTVRANSIAPRPHPGDSVFYCPSTPQMDCTLGCTRSLCTIDGLEPIE